MISLYVDGGLIGPNGKALGGTWALRVVEERPPLPDLVICEDSGIILDGGGCKITNNVTEMLAMVRGLQALGPDFSGRVCSDSMITLGRAFKGWRWTNIPAWMMRQYEAARRALVNWDRLEAVLLAGHPTRAQLESGIGHSGLPVSIHNVWCDQACSAQARKHLELIAHGEKV